MDQQLLVFLTVVDKENFTRAAESLNLTQSAVTAAVKALEKKLNAKLLDRSNKFIRLTKAGEIVYHHGKIIIQEYERIQRLIDDLSYSASGTIKIGASFTYGEYILPKLVGRFTKQYPEIHPEIYIQNSRQVVHGLVKDELDIGIIEASVEHEQLTIIPFAKDEMTLILPANHPFAKEDEIELTALSEEVWIIREEGSGTRQALEDLFENYHFTPKMTRVFGSAQIIKESVEAGLGIALLSNSVIQKELALGTLSSVRIKNQSIVRNFYYALRKSKFQPRTIELFLDWVKNGG